jgi:ribosomal protein S12 methylthiotransferase accessory factor
MSAEPSTSTDILSLEDRLVSPFSLARIVKKIRLRPTHLPVFVYVADVPLVARKLGASGMPWVSGAALNEAVALRSVLGEAAERYSWCVPSHRVFKMALPTSLTENQVHVAEAPLLVSNGLSREDVLSRLAKTRIPWLSARRALDGTPWLVPACDLVQDWFPPDMNGWFAGTTNGLSAHVCRDTAALRAICELVERDAVMRVWYGRLRPKLHFDSGGRKSPLSNVLRQARGLGLSVSIFDVTTEYGIPCALATIRRVASGMECFAAGSACSPVPSHAAEKAVVEAAAMWNSLDGPFCVQTEQLNLQEALRMVDGLEDHVKLYAQHWAKQGYRFLYGATKRSHRRALSNDLARASTCLRAVVNSLEEHGRRVLLADITPDDVRGLGLHVIKATVPGLIPLVVGHFVPLNSRGIKRKTWCSTWPHPFP